MILNQNVPIENYFEMISNIPRGIENEKAISDYIVNFANERKLEVYQDALWNVVIRKKASPGYENAKPVILQAHMDMVCEKTPESDHDFAKDPLELYLENGWLHAKGTTLGADDGFGVAYILSVLDEKQLKHPPLECIFTTQEESGNWGAQYLKKSNLKAKRMIGLDGDQERKLFVSCYSSDRIKLTREYEKSPANGIGVELTMTKFCKGVYEGVMHSECGNTIKMMARILGKASAKGISYRIISWESGTGENFNPFEGKLLLTVKETDVEPFEEEARNEFQNILDEFEEDGYRGELCCKRQEYDQTAQALSEEDSFRVMQLIQLLPNNCFQQKTINNIGMATIKNGQVEILMSSRSCHASSEEQLLQQCRYLAELTGYKMETNIRYSPWPYRKDSPLRKLANEIAMKNWGYQMQEEICPGGLEVGWFCKEKTDLDVLMLGPDLKGLHTPDECMNMESFHRVYKLLIGMLEAMN